MSDAGVQVSSPQIRTEGQVRRIERKVKRQLLFSTQKVDGLQHKVEMGEEKIRESEKKRKEVVQTLRSKKEKMVELNNRVKQLTADVKKGTPLLKEKTKSEKELQKSNAVITELIDNNHDLESSVQQLSSTLTVQKQKTRKLQKKVSKLKSKKENVEESINILCAKLESGQNVEQCVGEICDEVCSLGGNTALIMSLAAAMRSTVPTKNKSAYSDHVSLLMIELQNLGVPQSSVGKVANACTKHLCGRELDHIVSRRTAGRMVRRGGILSDIQVAVALTDNASRGLRIGQDTTTRRGTEHVSTVWGIRKDDGTVRYLQSRVKWLPNHTADVQSTHVMKELQNCNAILDKMDIPAPKKLSIAYVVEFIGDHINNKLHRNLEAEHIRDIADLTASNTITPEEHGRLQFLYKSACQQHSCAKVSRSFFEGMQQQEPSDLAGSIGKYGINQKKGRTYEAVASKIIETASVQFSPDYANTSTTDYNWADIYRGWCAANNREYLRIGYVNKNRHYKHEYEARNIIDSTKNIIDFYESRREARDDVNDHQTLRNKDQIVFEGLSKSDIQAQLVAADAMRYAFHSPFLVMVKDDSVDVLSIGQHVRQFHQLLSDVANNANSASDVLNGDKILYGGQFGDQFTKPVGIGIYGEDIRQRAIEYLRAGCKSAAAGLYSISREYFDGGQYFQPTEGMVTSLSGMEAHTDRNEGNFGQFSQQLRREPNARLQTISSKVAMRANNTISQARENPVLTSCISNTRKLERLESENTIQAQLSEISKENEPHLEAIRETVARRKQKRVQKSEDISTQLRKDGPMNRKKDVDRLLQKYPRQAELKDVLKKHLHHLKSNNADTAADPNHKHLFMFSRDRKALTSLELSNNLKAILSLTNNSGQNDDDGGGGEGERDSDSINGGEDEDSDDDSDDDNDEEDDDSDDDSDDNDDDENLDTPPTVFLPTDIDSCIAVGFVDRWYPGYITNVISEDTAKVNFLHPVKSGLSCTTFKWPRPIDEMEVSVKAVISTHVELLPQGSSARLWEISNVKKLNVAFR